MSRATTTHSEHKALVVVESPAKARTLGKILGDGYDVRASLGHVRDLPERKLGVDVEKDFSPTYEVPQAKRQIVAGLARAAQGAPVVFLASDPDREGEAIAWHLVHATGLAGRPIRRVVFHEITKEAVLKAFDHPRDIDMQLVDAQQARRVLDRLVGYQISPLLWRKVRRGLSAGRVQSVALKMIVDREREIEAFVPQEYWSIEAELSKAGTAEEQAFRAQLVGYAGKGPKLELTGATQAEGVAARLREAAYRVLDVKRKDSLRYPAPPFTTSTLQQEAARRLRFSPRRTMAIAQQLYEGLPIGAEGPVGLITYMRTDSTRVSAGAQAEARAFITQRYGGDFVPARPRTHTRKAKGAQEAHEAVRPTSIAWEPALVKPHLTSEQFRLYELIWKRMVASQMAPAVLDATTVDIEARAHGHERPYLLRATASAVKFPGFLVLYSEAKDEEEQEAGPALPDLSAGDALKLLGVFPEQHFTQPPPRYTEATLIKALEKFGIGRPSTYAPTLSVIEERGYVEKKEAKLFPLPLGVVVSDLLNQHFAKIVDIGFTAEMETELDDVAGGRRGWVPVVADFYGPFRQALDAAADIPRVRVPDEPTDEVCQDCARPMVIRRGRFGPFLACSGFPECRHTRPLLAKTGARCPQCGGDIVRRKARKRSFYGCSNYPQCSFISARAPLAEACPNCGGALVGAGKKRAKCLACGQTTDLPEGEPVGAAR